MDSEKFCAPGPITYVPARTPLPKATWRYIGPALTENEVTCLPQISGGIPLLGKGTADPVAALLAKCEAHLAELMDELTYTKRRAQAAEAQLATIAKDALTRHDLFTLMQAHVIPENPANHDYQGPLSDDGVPVPDATHERFHQSIGDVLAGKVMPKAREQMRDALNNVPKPATPAGAIKGEPMPGRALSFSHQQIGMRLP